MIAKIEKRTFSRTQNNEVHLKIIDLFINLFP